MKYIIIIISFLFLSCGSKKVIVDKSYIKKDSITQESTKISIKEIDGTKVENNIITDEFKIIPLDSTKEIVVNGIKYKNVVLSYKKIKDNSLYSNKKTIHYNQSKQQNNSVSTIKKEKKKEIDKKANYFIYLWLLLIPVILYLFKRFKSVLFI
jgi:hypothetical protein